MDKMISQERFDEIEMEHGCGYWYECCDRACPCAITTESKGLNQNIWDDLKKEQKRLMEEFIEEEEYDFDEEEDDFYDFGIEGEYH